MGETRLSPGATPLCTLDDGRSDGCLATDRCMGTYLHGILDNEAFVDFLLRPFSQKVSQPAPALSHKAFKQREYDRLADLVRSHLDMEKIYEILSES